MYVWVYFWSLYSVPLVSLPPCTSATLPIVSGRASCLSLLIFIRVLVLLDLILFYINVLVVLSSSTKKNPIDILVGFALNPWINFGEMDKLMKSYLSTHERDISLHLLRSL